PELLPASSQCGRRWPPHTSLGGFRRKRNLPLARRTPHIPVVRIRAPEEPLVKSRTLHRRLLREVAKRPRCITLILGFRQEVEENLFCTHGIKPRNSLRVVMQPGHHGAIVLRSAPAWMRRSTARSCSRSSWSSRARLASPPRFTL